ncbi:toxin glutamine deamidase domain-containing protein [Streptomyces sp. NPDC017529]|uniref:toxin glutamine deamidase domain-containing protein n=1 Tax=Streptomyces sp. NPDC017529 TaxID=3365000 RepID=UPI00378A14E0
MLPDPLEWVLDMLGFNWPHADEDKLIECAQVWRQFAAEVSGHQARGNSAASNVLSQNMGDSIEGFSKAWDKFADGSGYFDDARQAAEIIAFTLEAAAALVIGMKIAVITQLVILAAEIIAAQAAAPFTLGLSEIGAAAGTLATREVVRRILKEVAKQLLDAIMEAAKEPVISALEAMVSDLIAQTVNQNFGAQSGYDLGRTAKKGVEAGKDALKNTGETLGESLRDGAGSRAGRRARHGLDSAAGHGDSTGDGGGTGGGTGDGGGSGSGSRDGGGRSGNGSGSDGGSGSGSGSGDGGSGSGSGSGSGTGSGSGSSTGTGSGSSNSGSGSSGGGSGNNGGGSSASSSRSDSGGSGSPSADHGNAGTSHTPRPGDTSPSTDSGSNNTPSPAAADRSTPGPDGNRDVPRAQPLPPPDQRSPFDDGYQGGDSHSPYSSGAHASTPDGNTTPAADHNTPSDRHTSPDAASTQPAPDHTPDAARPNPDNNPNNVTTQPAPDTSRPTPAPAPDSISTQPAPDTTPDAARPTPDNGTTQPAAGPSPTPNPSPDTTPPPGHSNSPTPPSPDPITGNPPTNTNTDAGTPSDNNSGSGSRVSTPHMSAPPQGAPVQHSPSSGQPIQHRDPAPGDPMPRVDESDIGVATQSADTMTAPPPTQHHADPSTTTPTTPQQPQQNTPPAAGPVIGAPTTPPQGATTPRSNTPPSTTPTPSSPTNRRPDGSQAIRDVTQQRQPERPAYNRRLDGPRRDTPTTPPRDNRRPDGSQAIHDHTQQPRPERPPHNSRPDSPTHPETTNRPNQTPTTPNPQTPSAPTPTTPHPSQQPHNQQPSQQQPHHQQNPYTQQPAPQPNPYQQQPHPHPNQPQPTLQSHTPIPTPTPHQTPQNHQQATPQHQPPQHQPFPQQPTPHHPAPHQQQAPQQPVPHPQAPPHQQPYQAPIPQDPNRPSINHVRASLNHAPSGLYSPYPHDQQALEANFPRNPDGSPRPFNDPFAPWAQYQNDGGPTVLGRSNNCADCTRSFMESWYGNPQVSAVRTYDPDGQGGIDRASGERDGTRNIEQWAGTQFRNSGPNSQDAYARIADELRQAGHGAAAAVLVTWPKKPNGDPGGAHVFNAVNHNGHVVWVDSQTGEISHQPINTAADGVWHLTLDANRTPYDPTQAQTQTPHQQQPHLHSQQNQSQHQPQNAPQPHQQQAPHTYSQQPQPHPQPGPYQPSPQLHHQPSLYSQHPHPQPPNPHSQSNPYHPTSPSEHPHPGVRPGSPGLPNPSHPPLDPGSAPSHSTSDAASPSHTNENDPDQRPYTDPRDRGTSDTSAQDTEGNRVSEAEDRLSREYGLTPDALQEELRRQRDVHRVGLDDVHQQLNNWADNGQLARVLRLTSGDSEHPEDVGRKPAMFTRRQLSELLPGFEQMKHGEQMAVISSLGRMSLSFHRRQGVGSSPEAVTHPYRSADEDPAKPGTKDSNAKNARESLGVRGHRKSGRKYMSDLKDVFSDSKKAKKHSPDWTDRNYAVLEVQGPPPDHEITYVVDASVPAGEKKVSPRHSERHLMQWLDRVNEGKKEHEQFKPTGLYTEREPCGEGQGHARCSEVLLDQRLEDVPIYYSTTYRTDPQGLVDRDRVTDERDQVLATVPGLTHEQTRDEIARRLAERYGSNSRRIPKALAEIDGKDFTTAQKKLRDVITSEYKKKRDDARTHKERAMVAEMDRHVSALQQTWHRLLPQLA